MENKKQRIFIRVAIIIMVIYIACEVSDFHRNYYEKNQPVMAAQTEEEKQYIPENLNYSEMIKSIKRAEGIAEEEEPAPVVAGNQEEDSQSDRIAVSKPSDYIEVAKYFLEEARKQPDEAHKRLKVKKALKYYKEFLKYYPEDIDGLLGAGAMATYLGREDDAKNILMQAYATYPKNPAVHKALGDYSFKFSNYNNAIEYYNLSLASGNLKDYATNIATAVCYEKLGDIPRAKEYFKVAQYLNPDSALANQRVQMYEAMEHEGYSADTRVYDDAQKPDEASDTELETLLLDSQQIK